MFFTREDILKIQAELTKLGVKDSDFRDAHTPLDNNDILVLSQGGRNVKIRIQDFLEQLHLLSSDDFINVTTKFDAHHLSLQEAIQILPSKVRKIGLTITFQNIEGNWEIWQFTSNNIHQFNEPSAWENCKVSVDSIAIPDEEDLTMITQGTRQVTKFKDKTYDPASFSGKGRVYLRKNVTKVQDPNTKETKTVNLLTQKMLGKENTIYIIQYDYDLNGQTITVPSRCTLKFDGGSFSNGTLEGTDTAISAPIEVIFNSITIAGTWVIDEAYSRWFYNNSIQDCIDAFDKVSLTGYNEIDSTIRYTKPDVQVTFNFKSGSVLKPSSKFKDEYLIYVCKNTGATGEAVPNNKLVIKGVNESHIDCDFRSAFLYTEYDEVNTKSRRSELSDFTAINIANKDRSSSTTCGVHIAASSNIINVNLSSGRKYPTTDYDFPYMIYFRGYDTIVSNMVVITSQIGLGNVGGSTLLNNIHVWGAPKVAFEFNNGVFADNLYFDWAKVCIKYVGTSWGGNITVTNCHSVNAPENTDVPTNIPYKASNCALLQSDYPIKGFIKYQSAYPLKSIINTNGDEVSYPEMVIDWYGNEDSVTSSNRHYKMIHNGGIVKFCNANLSSTRCLSFAISTDYPQYICSRIVRQSNTTNYILKVTDFTAQPYNILNAFDVYLKRLENGTYDIYIRTNLSYCIVKQIDEDVSNIRNTNYRYYGEIVDESEIESLTPLFKHFPIITSNNSFPAQGICEGDKLFDSSSKRSYNYVLGTWFNEQGFPREYLQKGASTSRPDVDSTYSGFQYFDTTLNKPIWWTGSKWVDSTGADV